MKVFMISQGQDIGGQSARTAHAFKRLAPDWEVRAMHVGETYIKYPVDLTWDIDLARKLYAEADVIHHQNWLFAYAMYDGKLRKPAVVHHHGPPLRGEALAVNREAQSIGAVQIVSTVDLLADAPKATWSPCFYDIAKLRHDNPRPGKRKRLVVGHGPTVRAVKGTDAILAALDRVARRHDFDVDLVENVTWRESLKRKAACDIYIDQLTLGYGLSAIEAMALGVPVISGWADPEDRELFIRETGQTPPFLEAAPSDIDARLEELLTSAERREALAFAGAAFVEKWHDEAAGVERLKHTYKRAKPTNGIRALDLYGRVTKAQVLKRWAA